MLFELVHDPIPCDPDDEPVTFEPVDDSDFEFDDGMPF